MQWLLPLTMSQSYSLCGAPFGLRLLYFRSMILGDWIHLHPKLLGLPPSWLVDEMTLCFNYLVCTVRIRCSVYSVGAMRKHQIKGRAVRRGMRSRSHVFCDFCEPKTRNEDARCVRASMLILFCEALSEI